jgi:hypothetical protein
MLALLAASALADPAQPSLSNNTLDLGSSALDSFRHGDAYRPQITDDAMLPDRLAKLPAIPNLPAPKTTGKDNANPANSTTFTPALPVGRITPGPLPMYFRGSDWYDAAITVLTKRLAADPYNVPIRKMIILLKQARDGAPAALGDFDTAHERQLRQAPGLPQSAGEIGLAPTDYY